MNKWNIDAGGSIERGFWFPNNICANFWATLDPSRINANKVSTIETPENWKGSQIFEEFSQMVMGKLIENEKKKLNHRKFKFWGSTGRLSSRNPLVLLFFKARTCHQLVWIQKTFYLLSFTLLLIKHWYKIKKKQCQDRKHSWSSSLWSS